MVFSLDIKTLSRAIFVEFSDLSQEQSDELAWEIVSYFGFNDRILANVLDHAGLLLMYDLEDHGFVRMESMYDVLCTTGKEWRTVSVILCTARINQLSMQTRKIPPIDDPDVLISRIYESLPDEVFHSDFMERQENQPIANLVPIDSL